jgi:DNA replication protein DnaC
MEADELIDSMRRAREPVTGMRKPRYLSVPLLVIDELGFQALDRRDAHRLFQVVNYCYERSSTIITSNKSITEWPTMLAGDKALAASILDRLTHHVHILEMNGESFRLATSKKAQRRPGHGQNAGPKTLNEGDPITEN